MKGIINMKQYNRLYFWLLLFAFILFISGTSYAFDKSLDQGLDEIAQKVTKSIPAGAKKTVAVMDFNTLDGNVTMLGRFVSEELITKLFETERFKVIERSLLEKALEELKFNTTDLVDPTIAKQVGKVVGADAIVTGTLSDLVQSVKINARVIMVESGEVIGAAGAQIIKDASTEDMVKKVLTLRNTRVIKKDSQIAINSEYVINIESTTDDVEEVFLDGELLFANGHWEERSYASRTIAAGSHVLSYHVKNLRGSGGILSSVRDGNGSVLLNSQGDGTWKYIRVQPQHGWNEVEFNDSSWHSLVFVKDYGGKPWGNISGWTDVKADWIWLPVYESGSENTELWIRRLFTIP